jgi:hypothetical protein
MRLGLNSGHLNSETAVFQWTYVGRPSAPLRHWLVFSARQMVQARFTSLGRFLPRFLRLGTSVTVGMVQLAMPLGSVPKDEGSQVWWWCLKAGLSVSAERVDERNPVAGGENDWGGLDGGW